MSAAVFCCSPGDSVQQAQRVMETHQVRRLPVVDGTGRVVGIVALSDLAMQSIAPQRVAQTLRAVSMPRLAAAAQ
jgi:CBS-domain-containing membrane protein